jgi:hypothetical protein
VFSEMLDSFEPGKFPVEKRKGRFPGPLVFLGTSAPPRFAFAQQFFEAGNDGTRRPLAVVQGSIPVGRLPGAQAALVFGNHLFQVLRFDWHRL